MVPLPITEDYYMILEVVETVTPELIIRSYKRLALKLHPDRNPKHNATEAFQRLGRAYETLKDESKRRAYDLIYPSIRRSHPFPQTTQTPRPPPTPTSQSEALNEAAQIAAIRKSKEERGSRWRAKKGAFDSSIFLMQSNIRRLEQEIKTLNSIVTAAAATEVQNNSWGTWLLSPIYKKREDSQEEKECKDRKRQERRIEKDMKERRLDLKKEDLKKEESLLRKAKEEVEAADVVDNRKMQVIQNRIRTRETRERQEREALERVRAAKILKQQQEQREKLEREAAEALRKRQAEERERVAKIWKQQQEQREKLEREAAEERERMAKIWKQQQEQWLKRAREAEEASMKQETEERAAAQNRYEAQNRKWQNNVDNETKRWWEQAAHANVREGRTSQTYTSTCRHDGWWPKVQGRTECPKCYESWTYMLKCPGCEIQACPKCQAAIRPRMPRNPARANRRAPPKVRTPSPDYGYDGY